MSADRGQAGGDGAETARERPAWARAVEDVVARFEVEPEQGLTGREAKRRRKRHGANRLRETKRSSWARILLNQLESLVVWLLAAAGAASLLFAKWLEAMAIGVVIIINTAIGFFTELRAVRSMEALRRLGRVRTRVRRDGAMDEIDASRLVPGDIVAVEAGDVVAADMRVIEASKLQANESALTGESIPVTKSTAPVDAEAPVAERSCMLFKGSSVTRGSGFGVVVATGMETELGRVAALAEEAEQTVTPLERRLHGLAGKLTWVALSVATVTAIVGAVQGRSAVVMVETGVALAVAAIPEGLPIVATLALARGMWRMARRNALINRLAAVETLGATSVILTDKTGTLTENQMTVSRIALAERDIEVTGRGLEPSGSFRAEGGDIDAAEAPALRALLEVGALCNNASVETGEDTDAVGDPMEVALLVAAGKAGIRRPDLLERAPERREEAFDPETMSMATYHEEDGRLRVAVKGAPEAVIDACSRVRAGDDARALDGEEREAWVERATEMAASGLRMLAGAEKRVDSTDARPYEDLTLLGLYGMHDPPREEVKASLESCRDAGVRVVMVTGDQAGTARSVGEALGLVADGEETEVIEGADLPAPEEMAEEDRERLLAASIFARVAPEQKLRLIELHQEAGRIVAMTGDGVNDAPALRKADIGVAMGRRGTQVAREAADMVLQDDSFPTIVSAIGQGRVIFRNIRRFVVYLLSLHMSEILVVFGASAVGAPLPLLPLQILYLNIVTEIFPAMALGFGEGDERVLRDEPRDPEEPVITRRHWLAAGASALMIGGASLGAFAIALARLEFETDRAVTVSFLTLALAQVWHVFTMRGPGSRPIHNDVVRSPWVWGAVGLCVALLLSSVYLPWLSGALGTRDPGMIGWGVALGMSLLPAVVAQGWIAWVGRGGSRRNSRSEERRAGE